MGVAAGAGVSFGAAPGALASAPPPRGTSGFAGGVDFASRAAYDHVEEALRPYGLEHETNDGRVLTWQSSYLNLSYVFMYQAHRDPVYLNRLIEHTDQVLASRDSERGVVDHYRGTSEPAWSAVRDENGFEARQLDASHTGMIIWPMVSFVRTVHETPPLLRLEPYASKAQEYLEAIQDAVAVHDIQYGETEEGFGYYQFLRGEHYDPDGIEYPHNKALAMGRVLIHLGAITGEQQYWDKASGLARTFRSDLQVDEGGAYVWPYHWTQSWGYRGWTEDDDVSDNRDSFEGNPRIEDITHGALDIEFAVLAFRHNLVFDGQDMVRFARTFTQNLVESTEDGGYRFWDNVDGTGDIGGESEESQAAYYLPLAHWDAEVAEVNHAVYAALGFPDSRTQMARMAAGSAHLNRWEKGAPAAPSAAYPPRTR